MKTKQIFQNEKGTLFTLENYDKVSGVCHEHGITWHSQVDDLTRRAMHERGQLHYIFGSGDRGILKNITRRGKYGAFEVK